MVQKKRNWTKELKSGVLLAVIACAAMFIFLFLSCFDLYTLSHLKLSEAKMYADGIYRQEALRAEALFDQGEFDARKNFLAAHQSAMVDFGRSCPGGVGAYWNAFGKYWNNYFFARKVYNMRVAQLNKECKAIRADARREGDKIMRQAWAEIDPMSLIFVGKAHGKIRGYFYDPANGKLEPQIGFVNKGKVSYEKK
jgi:hypothetical protein